MHNVLALFHAFIIVYSLWLFIYLNMYSLNIKYSIWNDKYLYFPEEVEEGQLIHQYILWSFLPFKFKVNFYVGNLWGLFWGHVIIQSVRFMEITSSLSLSLIIYTPLSLLAVASLLRAHPHQLHGNAVHKRTESNHFVLVARGAIFYKTYKCL